jgi:hypothetical protein
MIFVAGRVESEGYEESDSNRMAAQRRNVKDSPSFDTEKLMITL